MREIPYSHDIGIRMAGDFSGPWSIVSDQAAAVRPTPTAATTRHEKTRTTRCTASPPIASTISMEMWESRVTSTPATTNVSHTRLNRASSPVQGHPSNGR
jgi:hypothetical protein